MLLFNNDQRNWHMTEGIELPNQEKMRMLGGKETCKTLGILKADTIKQVKKRKFLKIGNVETTGKKLHSKNLIKVIKTWTVPLIKYSEPFLKWTKTELNEWTREQENSWRCIRPYIPEMM